ncbi:MAG: class I poly(R)-hydroxyalkanoic acid synthase [Alphaproteobacteria bacterium]|nr:class I poly(R)-hydroxyalkanoic acid synthase [Alphaproteobacteria bacterium]
MAFSHNWASVMQRAQPLIQEILEQVRSQEAFHDKSFDPLNIKPAYMSLWKTWADNPLQLVDWGVEYWQQFMTLCHNSALKFMGKDAADIIEPEKGDKRFKDPAWQQSAVFDFLKQSYLLTASAVQRAVHETSFTDPHEKAKVEFYTKQFVDAFSPSNFFMTNPEVLRTTLETGGENIINGLKNLLEDLQRGKGKLKISKTDYAAFKIGENLALTKGNVIYRNDMMELIEYAPQTESVYSVPLLICPPWINKYYILDLRPQNSFINWAVQQGYRVFVISWVNPGPKHANKNFSDYMDDGLLKAAETITKHTGTEKMNVVGYCIGGTLLTLTLAYLAAAKKESPFISATFLTTLIDFKNAGDLALFTDEAQIQWLEQQMQETGILDSNVLQTTFSMLRANDLVWSYIVNNYMLGREPFPFDILYWNDDSTNMPAAMHSYYLRNMYLRNFLAQHKKLCVKGELLDVTDINIPAYFLSTKEDHIAPWRATFNGAHLLGGDDVQFTLAASGHVAGVVNPPTSGKYGYWKNPAKEQKPDKWLEEAKYHEGSWWTDWTDWLKGFSGKKETPQEGSLKPLCKAPGTYVR